MQYLIPMNNEVINGIILCLDARSSRENLLYKDSAHESHEILFFKTQEPRNSGGQGPPSPISCTLIGNNKEGGGSFS